MNFDEAMTVLRSRYTTDPEAREALTVVGKHSTKTVEAARLQFRKDTTTMLDKGCNTVRCPVCDWKHNVHYRKLYDLMAQALIYLCKFHNETGTWVHNERVWLAVKRHVGDFSKLAWWGLMVERVKTEEDGDKKTSGYWKPTQKGYDFVNRKIRVPSHCWELHSVVQQWQHSTVSIDEALGEKFKWSELWGPDDYRAQLALGFRGYE